MSATASTLPFFGRDTLRRSDITWHINPKEEEDELEEINLSPENSRGANMSTNFSAKMQKGDDEGLEDSDESGSAIASDSKADTDSDEDDDDDSSKYDESTDSESDDSSYTDESDSDDSDDDDDDDDDDNTDDDSEDDDSDEDDSDTEEDESDDDDDDEDDTISESDGSSLCSDDDDEDDEDDDDDSEDDDDDDDDESAESDQGVATPPRPNSARPKASLGFEVVSGGKARQVEGNKYVTRMAGKTPMSIISSTLFGGNETVTVPHSGFTLAPKTSSDVNQLFLFGQQGSSPLWAAPSQSSSVFSAISRSVLSDRRTT